MTCKLFVISAMFALIAFSTAVSKYSQELNLKRNESEDDRPFRMWKLNVVWQKANQVS